jgi:hypothetical protein
LEIFGNHLLFLSTLAVVGSIVGSPKGETSRRLAAMFDRSSRQLLEASSVPESPKQAACGALPEPCRASRVESEATSF